MISSRRRSLSEFLQARLSQRIVAWVFLSIVVIEAIILVPSVYRRERELLTYLRSLSSAQASGILDSQAMEQLSDTQLLTYLKNIQRNEWVLGGALYQADGELIGTFGEPPDLTLDQVMKGRIDLYHRRDDRYDALWTTSSLKEEYSVIIRHDARWVRREFFNFIGRITGLVLIISVFVTGATLLVLERLIIQPILLLRRDLLTAGQAIQEDCDVQSLQFASSTLQRRDELGDVIGAFDRMFGQITEAIATRKESEMRFRTLVEQAAEAFYVVDRQARVTDVNQAACEYLGYSRTELMQMQVPDIQTAFSRADFEQLWESLQPGVPRTLEAVHRRKDGTTFPVEARVGLLELEDTQLILALVRDITERKAAEQAVARLAEIGELAAMIVHEVRNPLTTIKMGLTALQQADLGDRNHRRLGLALEESERLQRLLNEILMYARRQALKPVSFALGPFMHTLAATLQAIPQAQQRLIQVETPPEDLKIWADPDKLKQVFINLIQNACEAAPTGSIITWRAECSEPSTLCIRIHNPGEPIPPEILAKLTQPFFTTKSAGNGLGLAITQRIIEAHQGELYFESTATVGTTVTIRLPLSGSPPDVMPT